VVVPSVVDSTPPAFQTPKPVPTVSIGDQRFAIVLLGYGGSNHDGAYLTDSIMVVIVDPRQKSLTLLSVPRDSWIPMYFDGQTAVYNKVNTAYAFAKDPSLYPDRLDKYSGAQGPGVFATDTISRLIGVPVTYYVGLDFEGFRQMINAVGGVDVDVPTGFVARYPVNDDAEINASWTTIRFDSGPQHMDGERAIEYARARETLDNSGEGSDFARSRRQRLIIEAFKQQLLRPAGLLHLPQLLSIASQHLDTNYAIPAVSQLSQLALDWKDVRFYQTALTENNYLEEGTGPDGTYVLVPNTPDHSWAQVRAFVRQLWNNPAAGVAMASTTVIVENDSGSAGLATRVSTGLVALGYQVDVRDGSLRETTDIVDHTGGHAGPLIAQLEQDLQLRDTNVVSPADGTAAGAVGLAAPDQSSNLVIQLGADEANLSVSVPPDTTAPSSTVGILKFGAWVPDLGAPTPTPVEVAPVNLSATPSPTPPLGPANSPLPAPPIRATPIVVSGSSDVVVVPDLVGFPLADAQRVINDSGLMTTYVNYQTAGEVADHKFFLSIAPGAVLSQSPRPGTRVSRGTKVALAVRKP
ncbi:MAG: LCP family protein, partial [Chloroflexota bacterium]